MELIELKRDPILILNTIDIWKKNQQHIYRFGLIKMEYYRSNIAGAIAQHNPIDTNNIVLNSATDSYASTYWNIPYTDGLSPMKQIEGRIYLNFSF